MNKNWFFSIEGFIFYKISENCKKNTTYGPYSHCVFCSTNHLKPNDIQFTHIQKGEKHKCLPFLHDKWLNQLLDYQNWCILIRQSVIGVSNQLSFEILQSVTSLFCGFPKVAARTLIRTTTHAHFSRDIFTIFEHLNTRQILSVCPSGAALILPALFALLSFPKSLKQECRLSRTMSLVMLSGHTE